MIFKLPIEFPAEDDGVREVDLKFQNDIDQQIDALYFLFGIVPIVVTGSVERRAETIKIALESVR